VIYISLLQYLYSSIAIYKPLQATQERHENSLLRQEIDQLQSENVSLREALRNPICLICGGRGLNGDLISFDEQQLRYENAHLKDELDKVCALVEKRSCGVFVKVE